MKIYETYVKRYFAPQHMGLHPKLCEKYFSSKYFTKRDERIKEIQQELQQIDIVDLREYLTEHFGIPPRVARSFMHKNAIANDIEEGLYENHGVWNKIHTRVDALKENLEQIVHFKK